MEERDEAEGRVCLGAGAVERERSRRRRAGLRKQLERRNIAVGSEQTMRVSETCVCRAEHRVFRNSALEIVGRLEQSITVPADQIESPLQIEIVCLGITRHMATRAGGRRTAQRWTECARIALVSSS
jgi:hypothetical protein